MIIENVNIDMQWIVLDIGFSIIDFDNVNNNNNLGLSLGLIKKRFKITEN